MCVAAGIVSSMPEPKLPDDLVMAIGRVAVNGLRLEVDVTFNLWLQCFPERDDPRHKEPPFRWSDALSGLKAYSRKTFQGADLREILVILHEADLAQRERNLCVHGMWSARPFRGSQHTVTNIRRGSEVSYYSISDVHRVANGLHLLRNRLMRQIHVFDSALARPGLERYAKTSEEMAAFQAANPGIPGIA